MNTGLTRKLFGARIAEMFLIPFDVLETFFNGARTAEEKSQTSSLLNFLVFFTG